MYIHALCVMSTIDAKHSRRLCLYFFIEQYSSHRVLRLIDSNFLITDSYIVEWMKEAMNMTSGIFNSKYSTSVNRWYK